MTINERVQQTTVTRDQMKTSIDAVVAAVNSTGMQAAADPALGILRTLRGQIERHDLDCPGCGIVSLQIVYMTMHGEMPTGSN